jgi:hypothetical protein
VGGTPSRGGKTPPVGTYRVNRTTDLSEKAIVLSNLDNHASIIFVAAAVKSDPADKTSFSFEEVGGQVFLSKIKSADELFIIPVSRAEILEASAKSRSGSSASASSARGNKTSPQQKTGGPRRKPLVFIFRCLCNGRRLGHNGIRTILGCPTIRF